MVTINTYATNQPNGALAGVQMCDSPVVISVTVGNNTFPAQSSLHKAWVRVAKGTYNATAKRFEPAVWRDISFAAENNESFTLDISGALRSLIDEFAFDPNDVNSPKSYPVMQYSVAGMHSYLLNGSLETASSAYLVQSMYAVHGRLTERERISLGASGLTSAGIYVLTRKPAGVEECAYRINGQCTRTIIQPTVMALSSTNAPAASLKGRGEVSSTFSAYTDPMQTNYVEFYFINRLGGVESVAARTLEALSVELKQEVYPRVQAPRRIPRTHGNVYVHQQDVYDRYAMSSGPVNRAWSQWWTREFLTASAWWVRLTPGEGTWIPCTVTPASNKVSVYNRSSDEALHVDFEVTLNLT